MKAITIHVLKDMETIADEHGNIYFEPDEMEIESDYPDEETMELLIEMAFRIGKNDDFDNLMLTIFIALHQLLEGYDGESIQAKTVKFMVDQILPGWTPLS